MSNFFSNPQNVLHLSNRVLGVGLVMLLAGVYGAYFYAGHLSIVALVSMHAMTILGPTLLKIGYVMRLLSQYGLSQTPARVVA
ncbi:transmembrane sensor/regulator PpyR [Pseudomonas sp. S34]|uniref:transmembrane sensor/regulator PpyR n=1 Tax=Pseudomonas sp. S34 TaxID=1573718 RepID=UPI00132F30DF|nr:transmembrane sensor/regulator PpyR [Pseudomonas sp. S34]QHF39067.1 transmembrane sensor/regulator PpyR [Pseudomonas sp. S34]